MIKIELPIESKLELKFSDRQAAVLDYYFRYRPNHLILEGAIRSGKTWVNNILWLLHVASIPPPTKNFILTGRTMGALQRNIVTLLEEFTGLELKLNQYNEFMLGGHRMCCFGSDNENAYRAMTGMTSYGWLANEVTNQHHNTIVEAFNRCSGEGTKIFWDTNPDNPTHPVKIDHIDHSPLKDAKGNTILRSIHFKLEDNEFLTPEYIEQVKRTTPKGMWYDRRILGKWVASEGIIYTNWEEIDAIPDEVKSHSQRFYGVDFGFSVHPAVVVDVYFNGDEIWVDELLYSTGYNNLMLASEMLKLCDYGVPIYADKSEPKSIDEIASYDGLNISAATGGPDSVRVGIDWLSSKYIYVTARSKNIIKELQNYCWQINKDGEQLPVPIKKYDHAMDATRYACSEFIDVYRGRMGSFDAGDLGL